MSSRSSKFGLSAAKLLSHETTASSFLEGRGRAERVRKCFQRSGGCRSATAAAEEAGGGCGVKVEVEEVPSAIVEREEEDGSDEEEEVDEVFLLCCVGRRCSGFCWVRGDDDGLSAACG